MVESGISGMRFSISETAKYGDITRGPRVINKSSRAAMKTILKEIQSGKFTKQWVAEYKGQRLKNYNRLLKEGEKHQIEKTGPAPPRPHAVGARSATSRAHKRRMRSRLVSLPCLSASRQPHEPCSTIPTVMILSRFGPSQGGIYCRWWRGDVFCKGLSA